VAVCALAEDPLTQNALLEAGAVPVMVHTLLRMYFFYIEGDLAMQGEVTSLVACLAEDGAVAQKLLLAGAMQWLEELERFGVDQVQQAVFALAVHAAPAN
jgi:hypothetical protein